ncbi:MAG: hypothetical protein JO044_16760 [Mycobacteriaceae bacterium]|nr:hypothetical protein [Mycobacteriaceae bacterium]
MALDDLDAQIAAADAAQAQAEQTCKNEQQIAADVQNNLTSAANEKAVSDRDAAQQRLVALQNAQRAAVAAAQRAKRSKRRAARFGPGTEDPRRRLRTAHLPALTEARVSRVATRERNTSMNTTHNTSKKRLASAVGIAAAAVATPAALLAGAGTAQADAIPDVNGSPQVEVLYASNPFGLNASIVDGTNPGGVTERCHYHSNGVGTTPSDPFDADVFPNGPTPASLFIPGIQTGGTWTVTVSCDHAAPVTFQEIY